MAPKASPARASASPARTGPRNVPPTSRVLRSATPKKDKPGAKSNGDFYASLRTYVGCVSTLLLVMSTLVYMRPPSPSGGVCDAVGLSLLLKPSTKSIMTLWNCTKAYQEANWWFVLAFFETLYIGLKMLAIPAAFTLCLLAGALFPMPLCQIVTGIGEAVGSSLCYLLSRALFAPIVEHFFAEKLELMRAKAHEERQFMLSFNFFLRLTPFMPNWMINLGCPLVGVPLVPFFVGSLLGTQLSLLFLAVSGATLKEAGETGFDIDKVKAQGVKLGLLMAVLQCLPIAFVYFQKRAKASKPKKGKARKA